MVGFIIKFHVAPFDNPAGVFNGFGIMAQIPDHLFWRFEIELVGVEFKTVCIVKGISGLDTQQDFMGLHICPGEIVTVISGYQGNGEPLTHLQQPLIDLLLNGHAILLHLKKKIILSKCFKIIAGSFIGLINFPLKNLLGQFSLETCRQGNQSFAVLSQKFPVHPRLVVKSPKLGNGSQGTQAGISFPVLCQQHKVVQPLVIRCCFIGNSPGCHIYFASYQGFDGAFECFLVERCSSKHGTVIRHGNGIHTKFCAPFEQGIQPDGSVQQGVFRMDMEMVKFRGRGIGNFCHFIFCSPEFCAFTADFCAFISDFVLFSPDFVLFTSYFGILHIALKVVYTFLGRTLQNGT